MAWLDYDFNKRIENLDKIMVHVRFPLIEISYLERIARDPIIKKNPKCQDLIINSLFYLISKEKNPNSPDISGVSVKPRVQLGLPQHLLIVGGQGPKPVATIDAYEFRSHEWLKYPELAKPRCRAGYNDDIYIIPNFN